MQFLKSQKYFNLDPHDEEFWNALSHFLGILMGIVGLILLLIYKRGGSPYGTWSILIYGFSIVLLYTASTSYHIVRQTRLKRILHIVDHISIYFLIAGTYTPVALIILQDGSGWIIFWIVWGITIMGCLLKIFFTGRFEILSLLLYLAMGWLIVFFYGELTQSISPENKLFFWLGGLFYTVGSLFYMLRKLPFNHFIWHLFVLAGSISHFLFIFFEVI
jgi:hemolysin III